ncbi:pickpocket protein 28-like [Phlebotomus argentipes]|uniref:pickpocket protein 28-like n=1 Tax=Phlebotomus argentipes TaxID=94469 RepID=UPI002892C4C8|nr:pickpocket protein 28-like [Phlebotomus argentipes]
MLRPVKTISFPQKEKEEKASAMDNFHHYLMNSSLHGLKYIGDKGITLFERFFFVLAFITVSLLSGYFISNVWQKWSKYPVIISVNPMGVSLNSIPFPAVTICNMNQARLSSAQKIAKGSLEDSLLDSTCGFDKEFRTENTISGKWIHFRKFLLNSSQPCSEMMVMCRFAAKKQNCMDIFWSSLTDDGLCCTFNTVHPDFMFHGPLTENKWDSDEKNSSKGVAINWTPETGYPKKLPPNSFPRPIPGAGKNVGLTVAMNCEVGNYYCSSTNSAGFKVLLHAPIETPKITNYGFYVAPGTETRVVVSPTINEASEMIRRVDQRQRQCVFANEYKLFYFRTYTQKNCEMECESKIIAEHCGCILYYMPKTTADAQICSLDDADCYEPLKTAMKINGTLTCSCLPACFEISYERRSSTTPLGLGNFLIKDRFLSKYPRQFLNFTKGELIGFTEFLSSTGGLLGLFMGFSVVSLIEIVYYITMRPHCMKRKRRKRKIAPVFQAWKSTSNRQLGVHVYPYCE